MVNRSVEFVVHWHGGGASTCDTYAVGEGEVEDAAKARAWARVEELLARADVEGVRLERREPSPHHSRYDTTTLYPKPED